MSTMPQDFKLGGPDQVIAFSLKCTNESNSMFYGHDMAFVISRGAIQLYDVQGTATYGKWPMTIAALKEHNETVTLNDDGAAATSINMNSILVGTYDTSGVIRLQPVLWGSTWWVISSDTRGNWSKVPNRQVVVKLVYF